MKRTTILLVILFCFAGQANAQFFKKLGKKAEKAAERAVERRVEKKATEETNRVLDSTLDRKRKTNTKPKSNRSASIPGTTKATPAASYSFGHKAVMQIINGKEVMDVDYFLPNSGSYFGMGIKDKRVKGDFKMVYDTEREAMFTFMNNEGQKIKMGMSFESDSSTDDAPDFDISATGKTKTILGYNCKEYKMSSDNINATVWVTKDVDIRFPSTFHSVKKNKSNNQEWMKDLDGWAMEMIMIDTSQKKPQTIKMNCLSIDSSNLTINSSDYNSLGY